MSKEEDVAEELICGKNEDPQKWRVRRLVRKWNKDVNRGYIHNAIARSKTTNPLLRWQHLVWQELAMWVRIEKQVTKEDLDFMVELRGFDEEMENYLKDTLIYIGLGENLGV